MTATLLRARNLTVETTMANSEALALLARVSSNFARDLCEKAARSGLSEAQWAWAHKLAMEQAEREQAPRAGTVTAPVAAERFGKIVAMLTHARAHLQHPKLTIELPDIGRVRLSLAGERSRAPGSVNVTDGRPFGENTYYGRIAVDGTFEAARACTPALLEALRAMDRDPLAAASVHGRRYGYCCFCARTLTDARSVHVGYGPVCAEHHGLAWGARPETAEETADADAERQLGIR